MTPTVSVLTGLDCATPSNVVFTSGRFTLEAPSKIGKAVKTTGESRTRKSFGVLGCVVHCNSIPVFVPGQSQSPVFTKWHFFIVLTQAFSRLNESVINKKNM